MRGKGLLYEVTGDLLPPRIKLDLEKSLKVADVATGTGSWLFQVQTILSSKSTLNGFDITDAQFHAIRQDRMCPCKSTIRDCISLKQNSISTTLSTPTC
jgi:hypothetical protein